LLGKTRGESQKKKGGVRAWELPGGGPCRHPRAKETGRSCCERSGGQDKGERLKKQKGCSRTVGGEPEKKQGKNKKEVTTFSLGPKMLWEEKSRKKKKKTKKHQPANQNETKGGLGAHWGGTKHEGWSFGNRTNRRTRAKRRTRKRPEGKGEKGKPPRSEKKGGQGRGTGTHRAAGKDRGGQKGCQNKQQRGQRRAARKGNKKATTKKKRTGDC